MTDDQHAAGGLTGRSGATGPFIGVEPDVPERFIPLDPAKRGRARRLMREAARLFDERDDPPEA